MRHFILQCVLKEMNSNNVEAILLLYTFIRLSDVVVVVEVVDDGGVDDVGQSPAKQASVSVLLELASLQLSKFTPLSTQ